MSDTLTLSDVPDMNDTVPSSTHKNVFINEFETKYSIIMSKGVPLCRFTSYRKWFCLL